MKGWMVTMRFCPNCENILIPKNKKLYCKVCNQEFELKPDCFNEYKIIITIRHEEEQFMPIINKNN